MSLLNQLPLDIRRLLWREYLDYLDKNMYQIAIGLETRLDQLGISIHYTIINGYLNLLKWIDQKGYLIAYREVYAAAEYGQIHVLEWLRTKYDFNDSQISASAAISGDINVLSWLRDKNVPFASACCANAALRGHLHVIKWLLACGYPYDEYVCVFAGMSGRLDLLKWLRENNFTWDQDRICHYAKKNPRKFHVLEWIHQIERCKINCKFNKRNV